MSTNVRAPSSSSGQASVKYGPPGSSETSPVNTRKVSPPSLSPTSHRKLSSGVMGPPQRPSKLPVVSQYNPKQYQRKMTPPGVEMDPVSRMMISSKRGVSPARVLTKRTASPKRGDISRRVSSPVFTGRRRSPSLTRSVSIQDYNL